MSKGSELYEWLDGQSAGGQLDSEGHFTLKHDEAWSKLTAFQFPVEEGWVLKLVQATSALEGATLSVSQLANETVFLVRHTSGWTRERVEDTIFSLDLSASSDVRHLSVLVRILVQMKDRPFSIRYDSGEKVVWTGSGFVQVSASAVPVFELRVGHFSFEQRRTGMSGPLGARVSASIAAALRQHCHLAPESIFIDGYLITTGENDQDLGSPSQGRPLGLLQVWDECELPTFKLASTNRAPRANLGRQQAYLDTYRAPQLRGNQTCYAACLLAVFLNSEGKLQARNSKILWLNDGVVVHREPLDMEPRTVGIGVVISSEGLETDISGLVPRQNEEYRERRLLGLEVVYQDLRQLVDKLGDEGITTRASSGLPTALGGAGLMFLFKVPVISAGLLTFAGVTYMINREAVGSVDERLDEDLQGLVSEFGRLIQGEKVKDRSVPK